MYRAIEDLIKMVEEIPCHCDDAFSKRGRADPHCPRCPYIDESIVTAARDELAAARELEIARQEI